jgi:hypothetical protein
VAIDRLQSGIGVNRETVGSEADNGTWGLSAPEKERERGSYHISREIARTQDVCHLSMHDTQSTNLWSWQGMDLDTLREGEMSLGRR